MATDLYTRARARDAAAESSYPSSPLSGGIGGSLDWTRLANLHRPSDPVLIAREVRRLAANGLTERDIGQALRLDPAAVRAALTERAA